ncbi:MAG: CHAT domain-containing protein [Pirellulales bacterium]|nr:CHAT domain-containing protein [Pirellulales bacterium]
MHTRRRAFCPSLKSVRLVLLVLLIVGVSADASHAQFGRQRVPTVRYQATFRDLYDGEYLDALKSFRSEGRGAIKTAATRWIDSICYHAMTGECYYEIGQLPEALEHYTSALNLYVGFSDWMVRVKFDTLQPARQTDLRHQVTWGQSRRTSRPAQFRDTMLIGQGRLNAAEVFKQGGVLQNPMMFGIDVVEVVRCTTLAIRRRTELLGPTCAHDALTGELLTALSARPGLPNHWSECWIDIQLGLAQLAAGKEDQAIANLKRGLLAAGQYDHPMTPVALFELGRISMARGDLKAAADYFAETTYVAAFYHNIRVLEEAFHYGAIVHMVGQPKSVYPPLEEAVLWARRNRYRSLECSLLLSAAENHAALGQTARAANEIGEATRLLARRDMARGRTGARYAFVNARVLFQKKDAAAGDAAVAQAMDYMRHGSFRLFHMALVDRLYLADALPSRTAMDLFADVLRDPQPIDWSFWPAESLATLVTPHVEPLEHWFEAAMKRKAHETAMEITDLARRHRFFSSLPFGGRLESLRWILEGPEEVLGTRARLNRRDLRVLLPGYDKLSKEAGAVRQRLQQAPPVAKEAQQNAMQKEGLAQLAALSASQEALLREIAVSRAPADLVFPPLRTTADVQKALPEGTALLAFFATRQGVYAFLLNNAKYDYWLLASPTMLRKKTLGMFRDLGQFDANREITLDDLARKKWRQSCQEVLQSIVRGSSADFTTRFDQLIVVPDGLLWYVPFESLQVEVDGQPESLISRFQIRYAPTIGLAVPDGRRRKTSGPTAVAIGQLFPRDDNAVAQQAFDELAQVVPGAVALPAPLPAPSALYRILFDGLIVYEDIAADKGGVYAWQPIQTKRSKQGSTLGDWLSLPWGGPQTIILPGFHTAAETGLKRGVGHAPGEEMFLSVCGLMASGARTVLLSRWRTGGQTSFSLVREFAQELPHATPAEAWQRSVLLTRDTRINPENEPRVKLTTDQEPPKAEHPFFWAGYMLIDSGDAPQEAPEEQKPVLKP